MISQMFPSLKLKLTQSTFKWACSHMNFRHVPSQPRQILEVRATMFARALPARVGGFLVLSQFGQREEALSTANFTESWKCVSHRGGRRGI